MPRKQEKVELKKILKFEKHWLKSGRQKPMRYTRSLLGRYHVALQPDIEDNLKHTLEKSIQHYLLNPIEDKGELKRRMLSNLMLRDMEELRNQDYKILEKTALQNQWKVGLSAASKSMVHTLKKWNLEELPLELEYLYRTIEQVGTSYGADLFNYEERIYALKLMDLILTQETTEREKRLVELEKFTQIMHTQKNPIWAHHAQYHYEKVSKELAEHMTQSMMACYGFQCVPFIGMLTGAVGNYIIVQNVAHVALQFYKKRLIECKK